MIGKGVTPAGATERRLLGKTWVCEASMVRAWRQTSKLTNKRATGRAAQHEMSF